MQTESELSLNDVIKWKHISALLALCAGNSPVTGEIPSQRPVTRSFDILFDLSMNKRLSKQSWGWWFEEPSRSLWRHCNAGTVQTLTSEHVYGYAILKGHFEVTSWQNHTPAMAPGDISPCGASDRWTFTRYVNINIYWLEIWGVCSIYSLNVLTNHARRCRAIQVQRTPYSILTSTAYHQINTCEFPQPTTRCPIIIIRYGVLLLSLKYDF